MTSFWYWGFTSRRSDGSHFLLVDIDGISLGFLYERMGKHWNTSEAWIIKTREEHWHLYDFSPHMSLSRLLNTIAKLAGAETGFWKWTQRRGYATVRWDSNFRVIHKGTPPQEPVQVIYFESSQGKNTVQDRGADTLS